MNADNNIVQKCIYRFQTPNRNGHAWNTVLNTPFQACKLQLCVVIMKIPDPYYQNWFWMIKLLHLPSW